MRYIFIFIFMIPSIAFAQSTAQNGATSIVSASIAWHLMQSDRTMNVREIFADDQGNQYYSDFQAPVGKTAIMRLISDETALANSLGLTVGGGR